MMRKTHLSWANGYKHTQGHVRQMGTNTPKVMPGKWVQTHPRSCQTNGCKHTQGHARYMGTNTPMVMPDK